MTEPNPHGGPVLSWFYVNELNESTQFLGTCFFWNREKFLERIKNLCDAYEWDLKDVHSQHHYIGSILEGLPIV